MDKAVCCAPNGWPVRRGARLRARGLRYGRSPPSTGRRGFRSSPRNSAAHSSTRAWCDLSASKCCCRSSASAVSKDAAGRARRKTRIRLLQSDRVKSRAAVSPALTHQWPPHSLQRRSAPAAFGSNICTRPPPMPGCRKRGAQTEARRIAHRRSSQISSQAAQRSDQCELQGIKVRNETEPRSPARISRPLSAWRCMSWKRIARREQVCGQAIAAEHDIGERADLASRRRMRDAEDLGTP